MEKLHELLHDLSFWPNRIKIGKVEKLVANLHDKIAFVIRIRSLKEVLNHRWVMKNVHKVVKLNHNISLMTCIDMNSDLSNKSKNWFWKRFKLTNYAVFGKSTKNLIKQRDITLVLAEERQNYFVSVPNYDTTKENCFNVFIKTNDIYKDIAEGVETRFVTTNYVLDKPLPKEKNKKVIGLTLCLLGFSRPVVY